MKRRATLVMGAFLVMSGAAFAPQTAVAAGVFIPHGHVYGPDSELLPPLNSEADRIDAAADVREVELQRELREQREFQEQFDLMIDLNLYRPGRPYTPY